MECPTSTYGPSSPALMSSVGRSAAACRPSGACVESSVQPCPARSYAQTRVVVGDGRCDVAPGRGELTQPALQNDGRAARAGAVQVEPCGAATDLSGRDRPGRP